jgi:hypothetical protein
VPEVEQPSADSAVESDYETYLRQKSLNAVLTNSAIFAGVWFACGVVVVSVAVFVRPAADVVGMDSAGREHPITVIKVPNQVPGAKQ